MVSTDPPDVTAAFRTGLGATFTFLCDHERRAIRHLDIVEVTPPDFAHGLIALPYTFSLMPDLTIHRIYNGWWFVGRPTLEVVPGGAPRRLGRADGPPHGVLPLRLPLVLPAAEAPLDAREEPALVEARGV